MIGSGMDSDTEIPLSDVVASPLCVVLSATGVDDSGVVVSDSVLVVVVVLLNASLLTCFGNGAYFGLGVASARARAEARPKMTARRTILPIY